jgi:hypothetical protein
MAGHLGELNIYDLMRASSPWGRSQLPRRKGKDLSSL